MRKSNAGVVCRKCGHTSLEISHRHGWKDRLLNLLSFRPARCAKCHHRRYVRAALTHTMSYPSHAEGCVMPTRVNINATSRWR